MDVKIREFFDSVGSFFTGGDNFSWCDRDIVAGCERQVADSGSAESKNESIMRLSWALVHSRHPEDVNRGIAMLEASLGSLISPLQKREKLYLLAVGFHRNGDYSRSRELLEQCLGSHQLHCPPPVTSPSASTSPFVTLPSTIHDSAVRRPPSATLPDCTRLEAKAQTPQKVEEDRTAKGTFFASDGVIGIGIATIVVGLLGGGIAAVVARKKKW